MEEEKIIDEQIENVYIPEEEETVIPVEDGEIIVSSQNDVVEADIQEEEILNVTISENVGPNALKIVADHSFGLPRQHSIGAIEGLREELDEIERLKEVCSDNPNQANYYMWDDENPKQENRVGYFVSIRQKDNANKIHICDSVGDEFGVTVSAAGFIGNQHAEIPRNSSYGLVVHSGTVAVKCEKEEKFKSGDYVVSNKYGYAKKTDGTYGYRVNSVSAIDGVPHVIISFAANSKPLQRVSEIAHDVAERMKNAEYNIVVNRGVANDAYRMAQGALEQASNSNIQISDKLGEIIDQISSTVGKVDDLETSVGQAQNSATKAESLASSLGNQALNASVEAVAQANSALQAAQSARDEVYDISTQVKAGAEMALSTAQKAQEDIAALAEDLTPLSKWSDGDKSGVSGFVSKSDDYSTQLALISEWKQDADDRIAAIKTQADETSASIESLTSYSDKSCEVLDTWSKIEEPNRDPKLVYYVKDEQVYYYHDADTDTWLSSDKASDAGLPESITYIKQLVDENSSAITSATTQINGLETSITSVEQKANNNESKIDAIISRESDTSELIANIGAKADNNEVRITNLASYINKTYIELKSWPIDTTELKTDQVYFVDKHVNSEGTEVPAYYYYFQDPAWRTTTDPANAGLIASIANVTQKANANESSIQSITEWQGTTSGAIAELTQQVDATGGIIKGLVSNVNKYSVGEYSQANGLTHDEAKSILKSGTVFIPMSERAETYSDTYTQEFSKGFYYTWNGLHWVASDSSGDVAFSDTYIIGSVHTPYWVVGDAYCETTTGWHEGDKNIAKMYYVTDSDDHYYYYEDGHWVNAATPKYQVGALYKWEDDQWVEMITKESNILSRSTALMQQKVNEITLDVTNVAGSLAHLGVRIDEKGSTVDSIASVVTKVEGIDIEEIYASEDLMVSPDLNKYYAVGTKAPYDVYKGATKQRAMYYDGLNVMKPNIASIITAANEDETGIALSAHKINIDGSTTFSSMFNAGTTTINGDYIRSGTIASNDGTVFMNLSDNTVEISGKITATSGYIGNGTNGFEIKSTYISNGQTSYAGNDSGDRGVYIGTNGIGLGNGKFYVDDTGDLVTRGTVYFYGSSDTPLLTISGDTISFAGGTGSGGTGSTVSIKAIYSKSGSVSSLPKDYAAYIALQDKEGTWHKQYQSTDAYICYSYDGGKTWDDPIKFQGPKGETGSSGGGGGGGGGSSGLSESDVKDLLNKSYQISIASNTTTITSANITSPTISGGVISGAVFYSTGSGAVAEDSNGNYVVQGSNPAYYVADPTNKKNIRGWLSYDTNGEGNEYFGEAKNRVFLTTTGDTALKLKSGSNISLQADGGFDEYGNMRDGQGTVYIRAQAMQWYDTKNQVIHKFVTTANGEITGDGFSLDLSQIVRKDEIEGYVEDSIAKKKFLTHYISHGTDSYGEEIKQFIGAGKFHEWIFQYARGIVMSQDCWGQYVWDEKEGRIVGGKDEWGENSGISFFLDYPRPNRGAANQTAFTCLVVRDPFNPKTHDRTGGVIGVVPLLSPETLYQFEYGDLRGKYIELI